MKYAFLCTALLLAGCAPRPYSASNKLYKTQAKAFAKEIATYPLEDSLNNGDFIGTTNFNMRKPNFVIIHHTAQDNCGATLRAFTMQRSQVSAHYVICKDGTIYHLLNDYLRAWHAGVSKWGNDADINSNSIGIELDNNGFENFTDAQIASLLRLLDVLKKKYNIPVANFIGHGDIAPQRKDDPNVYFPWKLLADKGFGYWYTDTTNTTLPQSFDALQSLRIIGYNIKDTTAAMIAFKRHWLQDSTCCLDSAQMKILYSVMKQYE